MLVTGEPLTTGGWMLALERSAVLAGSASRRSVPARLLAAGSAPISEARALAVAVAALIISGEFTFRARDPSLALSGSADTQVVFALGISVIVGAWILTRRIWVQLVDARSGLAFQRLDPRSPLRVLRFLALVAVVSAFWSPTSIAVVRAVQFVVVVEVMAESVMTCRGNRRAIAAFQAALARVLVVGVALAAVITVAVPGFNPYFPTYHGPTRLRLLAMHPIATANLLAVVALLLLSPLLDLFRARDSTAPGTVGAAWRLAGCGVVVAAMVRTFERGSTLAGLLALLALVLLNSVPRRLQWILFWAVSTVIVMLTVFGSVIGFFVARGQTASSLASLSGRTQIFSEAARLFWLRPFTGWGYDAGRSIFLPTIPWAGESHNVLVEIAVSGGLLGLFAYALLFAWWFRMVRVGLRGVGLGHRLASLSIALTILIAVVGVGSDSFAGPPKLLVISLGLALMYAELAAGLASEAVSRYPVEASPTRP
jgi:O-antigen ligase